MNTISHKNDTKSAMCNYYFSFGAMDDSLFYLDDVVKGRVLVHCISGREQNTVDDLQQPPKRLHIWNDYLCVVLTKCRCNISYSGVVM